MNEKEEAAVTLEVVRIYLIGIREDLNRLERNIGKAVTQLDKAITASSEKGK